MNKNMRIVVALALGVVLVGGGILYFSWWPECVSWEQENLPGIAAGKQYVYVAMGDFSFNLALYDSIH